MRMEEQKLKIWNIDNTKLVLMLAFSTIIVYYSSYLLNQAFFLVLLVLFYRSKKDYFWLAFFLILFNAPGRLFQASYPGDIHRIPYYSMVNGISFAFDELLIAVTLFKASRKRNRIPRFIFRNEFKFLLIFAVFVLIYSLPFGMGFKSLIRAFRAIFPWFLVLSIPRLLQTEKDLSNFNRLVFPIVFFALASQLYSYTTGQYFVDFLNKGVQAVDSKVLEVTSTSDTAARSMSSMITLLYVFSQSLFYFFSNSPRFSRRYIAIVIFVSFVSVYLTATRGWILAFATILGLCIISFVQRETIKHLWKAVLLGLIIIFALVSIFPRVKIQFKNTSERLNTLNLMMEGDMSAGGTLVRVVERGPRVMSKFRESQFIGWGFSNTYFEYVDPHVGHHSMLLNVGILGYVILNMLFFLLIYKIFVMASKRAVVLMYNKSLKIFAYVFLGIYIIHSTSVQLWGLDIKYLLGLLYGLLFNSINILYHHSVDVFQEQHTNNLLTPLNQQV